MLKRLFWACVLMLGLSSAAAANAASFFDAANWSGNGTVVQTGPTSLTFTFSATNQTVSMAPIVVPTDPVTFSWSASIDGNGRGGLFMSVEMCLLFFCGPRDTLVAGTVVSPQNCAGPFDAICVPASGQGSETGSFDGLLAPDVRILLESRTDIPTTLTFSITQGTPAVPEPATWAMMVVGFGAIGGALRKRKARVAFA